MNPDMNGVVCAAVTPLTPGWNIDVSRLSMHCRRMLEAGCAYTSPFGTTGEGVAFSTVEKIDALKQMAEGGLDMSRQIPAIMTTSPTDAAELYRAAADLGCRAALILPPYYYPQGDTGSMAAFFETVVARAGAPRLEILLYNIPVFSGVTVTSELAARIRDVLDGRLIGIKDSTGNLDSGLSLIRDFPELSIFTGDDRILSRMAAGGGAGMIGGMVNLFPKECQMLYSGGANDALEALAAMRIEQIDANGGLAAIKALLAVRYDDPAFAETAPPVARLSAAAQQALADRLSIAPAKAAS